jgi:hypothetical protein
MATMQDYEFEVTITAVVRVRAKDETLARTVVSSSALSSPSAEEIRMANQGEFLLGKRATIIAVEFDKPDEDSVRLIGIVKGQ